MNWLAAGDKARVRSAVSYRLLHYCSAILLILLTTVLEEVARRELQVPDLEMLFLLAIVVAAVWLERGPAILATCLAVAAYYFFLVPPPLTLAIADLHYLLTVVLMLGAGLLVVQLAHQLRRKQAEVRVRGKQAQALHAFTRDLGAVADAEGVALLTVRHAADLFEAGVGLLLFDEAGQLTLRALEPPELQLSGDLEPLLSTLTAAHTSRSAIRGPLLCVPLRGAAELVEGAPGAAPQPPAVKGWLVLRFQPLRRPTAEQQLLTETLGQQAASSLTRVALAAQARQAAHRVGQEELRSSLLSALSHDLRTPLASIIGGATTLRDEAGLTPATRLELLGGIVEEAERLERLVTNLLDMTRLDSGAIVAQREWLPFEELIGPALERLGPRLGSRDVLLDLAPDLPLVAVDPVLFQQLLLNLLENVTKYTPAQGEVTVAARLEPGSLVVEVADRGPGLPPGSEERVFERFFRGAHPGIGGAGLGLPICRAIAKVHGGTLDAQPRPGGGALFRLRLPQPERPPVTDLGEGGTAESAGLELARGFEVPTEDR